MRRMEVFDCGTARKNSGFDSTSTVRGRHEVAQNPCTCGRTPGTVLLVTMLGTRSCEGDVFDNVKGAQSDAVRDRVCDATKTKSLRHPRMLSG